MTVDRRAFDPFAPHPPASLTGVVTPQDAGGPTEDVDDGGAGADPADGFDDMKRTELVELAVSRGLPGYGTKADIIARLRG